MYQIQCFKDVLLVSAWHQATLHAGMWHSTAMASQQQSPICESIPIFFLGTSQCHFCRSGISFLLRGMEEPSLRWWVDALNVWVSHKRFWLLPDSHSVTYMHLEGVVDNISKISNKINDVIYQHTSYRCCCYKRAFSVCVVAGNFQLFGCIACPCCSLRGLTTTCRSSWIIRQSPSELTMSFYWPKGQYGPENHSKLWL